MISKWESQKERLSKFMAIAPRKKLEWLQEMNEFLCKALTKKQRRIYHKLKETR